MDVLRVVGDYYPYVMGGLPLHVRNLSRDQAKKGLSMTVMTFGEAVQTESIKGLVLKTYAKYIVAFGNRLSIDFVRDLLKEVKKHDLVHAHSHLYLVTNLAALFCKVRGVTFIITNHGFYSQSMSVRIQRIFLATISRYSFSAADSIICYTDDEKQILVDHGVNREKIKVIHNGISTEDFCPVPSVRKDIDLLWVGRLVRGKDPLRFVDVVYTLKGQLPMIQALMIGDGPLRDEVDKKITNLGLEGNINIIEKLGNDDIPGQYVRSKVLVITSHFEGVPRTSLEAMSCGIPVVSTYIPQLKDVLGDAGVVIDEGGELVPPLLHILENSELRSSMGSMGRDRVVKSFSWDDTVNRINSLYEDVLKGKAMERRTL